MDCSSALYMCFRCYQLFDSLDDVLFHQYTLHPNDVGDEDSLTLPPGPQTESDEVFQCVPCWVLFSSLEELIQHQRSDSCSQHHPVPDKTSPAHPTTGPHLPPSTPNQQNHVQIGSSHAGTGQNCSKTSSSLLNPCGPQGQDQNVTATALSGPEQPAQRNHSKTGPGSANQIQYQCGDCGYLFESLGPWLHHRKLGQCHGTGLEPRRESEKESEGVEVAKGPEEVERVTDEAGTGDVQSAPEKEPMDSQNAQEDWTGEPDQNPKKKTGVNRKRRAKSSTASPVCRSFLCGVCGMGFNWQPALVAHRRTQHGLEEALHHCLECGESFMNTSLFVYHCKKHRDWLRGGNQRVENRGEKEIIRKRPTKRRLKRKPALEPGSELAPDGLPLPRKPRRRRGTPQECPQCRRTFSNPRYLHAHILSHSGQKQFHCEICGKTFTYQNNLRRHHILHTGARPYMCDRCGKTFTQSSHLKDHLRNHDKVFSWSRLCGRGAREQEWTDVGPKLPHPCPDCNRSFMTNTQLLMHRKMCPICERSFKWRGSLPAHIVRHTDNKLFSCEVCGKTFSYQTNLARHLIIHSGTRPYACRHCGKTFNQSSNLRQHLLVHAKAGARRRAAESEGGVPGPGLLHTCPECPSSFKTFTQLQKHRRSHTGQDWFLCSVCGLEPCKCQQEDLGSASHQDKESLSCPRCSVLFESQPELDSHTQSCEAGEGGVEGEGRGRPHRRGRRPKSSRQAECDMCGQCCASQEELDLHQLSHVGQAQLQCPLAPCPRCFTTSSALQNHLFSHFPGPTCQNLRPERFLNPTLRPSVDPPPPRRKQRWRQKLRAMSGSPAVLHCHNEAAGRSSLSAPGAPVCPQLQLQPEPRDASLGLNRGTPGRVSVANEQEFH
ncbi:hypothetical protein AAFF_G00071590 [Aldrovandia affinis]|uniref:C2H2-type domain-containing protein n=1 Tax=Aldrovandia affinis TaxID=143900 RepID=A0AAD7WDU9_9TELE|nr:hypothetical protein AAFF_G00071590 [Aldrovandia affinis]